MLQNMLWKSWRVVNLNFLNSLSRDFANNDILVTTHRNFFVKISRKSLFSCGKKLTSIRNKMQWYFSLVRHPNDCKLTMTSNLQHCSMSACIIITKIKTSIFEFFKNNLWWLHCLNKRRVWTKITLDVFLRQNIWYKKGVLGNIYNQYDF